MKTLLLPAQIRQLATKADLASAAFTSPVTRKLWQDRLSRDSKRASFAPDAPLAAREARKAENVSVTYSFSSEAILQEQVGPLAFKTSMHGL